MPSLPPYHAMVGQDGEEELGERWAMVVLAAVGLMLASNAPSLLLGVYVLSQPLSFEEWPFVYAFNGVALLGILLLSSELRHVGPRDWPWPIWPLTALVGWGLLSVTWSVRPDLTVNRSIVAVGIAAFGAWFGLALEDREQILTVALFSIVTVIGSLGLIAFWPNLGRSPIDGSWQGVFANSNSLAPAATFGILVAIAVFLEYRSIAIRAGAAVLGGLNLLLLVKSKGFTGYFALAAGTVVYLAFAVTPTIKRHVTNGAALGGVVGLVTITLGVYGWIHIGSLASAVGENSTLSSRTVIWDASEDFIRQRPWHGYGYWAFWENAEYSEPIGRWYGSAHNSLLEVAVGLGLIGATLFVVLVAAAVIGVTRRHWLRPSTTSGWWAALLAATLAEHSMESFVLWHSYVWILLVAAAFVPFRGHRTTHDPR